MIFEIFISLEQLRDEHNHQQPPFPFNISCIQGVYDEGIHPRPVVRGITTPATGAKQACPRPNPCVCLKKTNRSHGRSPRFCYVRFLGCQGELGIVESLEITPQARKCLQWPWYHRRAHNIVLRNPHQLGARTRNANGAPSEAFSGASSTLLPLSTIRPTHECPPPQPENAMSLPRRRIYHLRHHISELVENEVVPSSAAPTSVHSDRGLSQVRLPAPPSCVSMVVVAAAAAAAAVSMEGAVRGSGGHDCPIKNPLISCVLNVCVG